MDKDKYLNYTIKKNNDYKFPYKKYKIKYLQLKQIGGMFSQQAAEDNFKYQSDELKDGELWFFGSIFDPKIDIRCDEFKSGHIGISFDRNAYNVHKEIFGFSPISMEEFLSCSDEQCVAGSVTNQKDYFDSFLKTCTTVDMKSPNYLYKINIKYLDEKKEIFKNSSSTYSHPMKAPITFQEKFDSLEEFNNCITYLINTVEPLIESNNRELIKINLKKTQFDFGWAPGGYIAAFINDYSKYAVIPEIFLLNGPMSFSKFNTIKS